MSTTTDIDSGPRDGESPRAVTRSTDRPTSRHGLARREGRDPIGYAVAGLNKLAQSELLDRLRLRRPSEQLVFTVTRGGFKPVTAAGRQWGKVSRSSTPGKRPPSPSAHGVFDLTATEGEPDRKGAL